MYHFIKDIDILCLCGRRPVLILWLSPIVQTLAYHSGFNYFPRSSTIQGRVHVEVSDRCDRDYEHIVNFLIHPQSKVERSQPRSDAAHSRGPASCERVKIVQRHFLPRYSVCTWLASHPQANSTREPIFIPPVAIHSRPRASSNRI